jgi:hypothetical protein
VVGKSIKPAATLVRHQGVSTLTARLFRQKQLVWHAPRGYPGGLLSKPQRDGQRGRPDIRLPDGSSSSVPVAADVSPSDWAIDLANALRTVGECANRDDQGPDSNGCDLDELEDGQASIREQ